MLCRLAPRWRWVGGWDSGSWGKSDWGWTAAEASGSGWEGLVGRGLRVALGVADTSARSGAWPTGGAVQQPVIRPADVPLPRASLSWDLQACGGSGQRVRGGLGGSEGVRSECVHG